MKTKAKEQRNNLVKRKVEELSEFFDTVQIIATVQEDDGSDGTLIIKRGSGNMYARLASCREFLIEDEELTRDNMREKPERE